jgi:uncharacterized protein YkwD
MGLARFLAIVSCLAASTSCSPPAKIAAPAGLGAQQSTPDSMIVTLEKSGKGSDAGIYAVALAAAETSSVVFCAVDGSGLCEREEAQPMLFQRRADEGFYFISDRPLEFADRSTLLFLAYASTSGDKASQKATVLFRTDDDDPSADSQAVGDQAAQLPNSTAVPVASANRPNANTIDAATVTQLLEAMFASAGGSNVGSQQGTTQPVGVDQSPPSTLPPGGATASDPLVPNPNNVAMSQTEFEVVRLTNKFRQENGRPALVVEERIMVSSRESSRLMQEQNRMVHGLTSGWHGENIANGYSSPAAVVNGWINSPGHRANMLRGFSRIGVGDTSGQGGGTYWTQQFLN